MYLCDIMDLDLLDEMIEQGYVTARPHNSKPWVILNYTPKTQYEWKWNDVTLQARGLVYEINENGNRGEVIARPFKKFFNWDQGQGREDWHYSVPPPGPVIRMEKMDGSLGVLVVEHHLGPITEMIATRGSFHSEQAEWATQYYLNSLDKMIHELDYEDVFTPEEGKTYLFEIIYPGNRVVVDYGEYEGLVLIDVIDNETGKSDLQEFDDCNWPDKVARHVHLLGFDSGHAADIPKGDEGFVYLWPERNYRVKMKSAEYIELHRIVSNLSEKTIWEQLVNGRHVGQIKAGVPDEFHEFIDKTAQAINFATMDRVAEIYKKHDLIIAELLHKDEWTRKDFAALATKDDDAKYMFMILDKKEIYYEVMKEMKPVTNRSLVLEEEV